MNLSTMTTSQKLRVLAAVVRDPANEFHQVNNCVADLGHRLNNDGSLSELDYWDSFDLPAFDEKFGCTPVESLALYVSDYKSLEVGSSRETYIGGLPKADEAADVLEKLADKYESQ